MMILLKRLIKSGLPTGTMVVFALIAKFAYPSIGRIAKLAYAWATCPPGGGLWRSFE
jgi:hypothetical protein